MKTGTVKFFNKAKGFGFIKVDDTGEEVFVHAKDLLEPVEDNDKVTFELFDAKRGPAAVQVKKA